MTGSTVEDISRRLDVKIATFRVGRKQHGGMNAADAKDLRGLEDEPALVSRLRRCFEVSSA